ncbi:MAG: MBL fold metallo-hydrolase [Microbacteriaceae bacterium]|nr:MBL fold metallo-hydrolase [Microbacteriaceae bacterium]
MRCFRLSHAGLVVELDGSSLFIDPGNFSSTEELAAALSTAAPIAAIVITHEHADHWTPEHISALRAASPEAPIFTTEVTARSLAEAGITDRVHTVAETDHHTAGPFVLDFYGRRHEMIHSSIPVIENVGVQVNGTLAWGGDCLTRAPFVADVLGVPIGSPWSNVAQVMDFVLVNAPKRVYLTHDGMLSAKGLGFFRQRVEAALGPSGGVVLDVPHVGTDPAARCELGDPAVRA